jgi:hypothetical protein
LVCMAGKDDCYNINIYSSSGDVLGQFYTM